MSVHIECVSNGYIVQWSDPGDRLGGDTAVFHDMEGVCAYLTRRYATAKPEPQPEPSRTPARPSLPRDALDPWAGLDVAMKRSLAAIDEK